MEIRIGGAFVRLSIFLFSISLCVSLLVSPSARAAGTYWTTQDLLRSFFATSERVTYVEVGAADVERVLGQHLAKEKYIVFVAKTGEHVDGYAVIDDEKGQHQPITFGCKLSPTGEIVRVEVMAYREAYGEEVREQRFMRQFVGKRAADPLRFGTDVIAISGATISSRAMTIAVHRALLLVDLVRGAVGVGPRASLPVAGG